MGSKILPIHNKWFSLPLSFPIINTYNPNLNAKTTSRSIPYLCQTITQPPWATRIMSECHDLSITTSLSNGVLLVIWEESPTEHRKFAPALFIYHPCQKMSKRTPARRTRIVVSRPRNADGFYCCQTAERYHLEVDLMVCVLDVHPHHHSNTTLWLSLLYLNVLKN